MGVIQKRIRSAHPIVRALAAMAVFAVLVWIVEKPPLTAHAIEILLIGAVVLIGTWTANRSSASDPPT